MRNSISKYFTKNKTLCLLLISLTSILLINISLQELKVLSPEYLAKKIQAENKGTDGEIRSRNGRFGEIPYGKTISGNLYVHNITNSTNHDWCESYKYEYIDYSLLNYNTKTPVVVIANDENCPFAQKAMNVQKAGGKALIIYTNNNFYDWNLNVDDLTYGDNLKIPTKIITSASGQKLIDTVVELYKRSVKDNKDKEKSNLENVVVSLSYKNFLNKGQDVELTLYFRSDQIKAAHFFTEFKEYKKILGERLKFAPYYHYYVCPDCKGPYTINENDDTNEGCIGYFCGIVNHDLNIKNPKLVTLENLRQKCIYELYPLDYYWNYMILMDELCLNPTVDGANNFSSECISKVFTELSFIESSFEKKDHNKLIKDITINNYIKKIQIKNEKGEIVFSTEAVNECMDLSVKAMEAGNIDNIFENDMESFKVNKVHRYPVIELNGIKYKASWSAKHVFNSICAALGDNICHQGSTLEEIYVKQDEMPIWLVVLICFIVILVMLIVAYCYRRYVNKVIENSIEERIYKQTQETIGNYSKMEKNLVN